MKTAVWILLACLFLAPIPAFALGGGMWGTGSSASGLSAGVFNCNSGNTPCSITSPGLYRQATLLGNATAAQVTFNLPPTTGSAIVIYGCKTDASANQVIIHRAGANTINGAASDVTLTTQNQCAVLNDTSASNWTEIPTSTVGAVTVVSGTSPIGVTPGTTPNVSLSGVVAGTHGGTGCDLTPRHYAALPGAPNIGDTCVVDNSSICQCGTAVDGAGGATPKCPATWNGSNWFPCGGGTAPALAGGVTAVNGSGEISSSGGATPTISVGSPVTTAHGGRNCGAPTTYALRPVAPTAGDQCSFTDASTCTGTVSGGGTTWCPAYYDGANWVGFAGGGAGSGTVNAGGIGQEGFYAAAGNAISALPNVVHAGTGTLAAAFAACPGGNTACTVYADPGQTYSISTPLVIGSATKPETLVCNGARLNCTGVAGGDCVDIAEKGQFRGMVAANGSANTGCVISSSSTAVLTSLVHNNNTTNQAGFDLENVLLSPSGSSTISEGELWMDSVDGFATVRDVNFTAPPVGGSAYNALCSAAGTPFPCCTGSGTGTCTTNSGVQWLVDDGPAGAGGSRYWNDITADRVGLACGGANGGIGLDVVSQNGGGSNLTLLGGAIVDCAGSNPEVYIAGSTSSIENRNVGLLGTYIESYGSGGNTKTGDLATIKNSESVHLYNVNFHEAGGTATNCVHLLPDTQDFEFTGNARASGICTNVVRNDIDSYVNTSLGSISYHYPGTNGAGTVFDGTINPPLAYNSGGTNSSIGPTDVWQAFVNSATGATQDHLVQYGSGGKVHDVTAGTNTFVGICDSGCGATGTDRTLTGTSIHSCVFDNTPTANDYVTLSGTVNGDCSDTGISSLNTLPAGVVPVGIVSSITPTAPNDYPIFYRPNFAVAPPVPPPDPAAATYTNATKPACSAFNSTPLCFTDSNSAGCTGGSVYTGGSSNACMAYCNGLNYILTGGTCVLPGAPPSPPSLAAETMNPGALDANSVGLCTNSNTAGQRATNHTILTTQLSGLSSGGTLWVPNNCKIYLDSKADGTVQIPKPETLQCSGDNLAGFYNQSGYQYVGSSTVLANNTSHAANVTVRGCVLSNTFDPAATISGQTGYYNNLNQVLNGNGHPWYLYTGGGNDILGFYGTSNMATNNLITHNYAGEGVIFFFANSGLFTNNVIVDNAMNNALQVVDSQSMTISGNWVRNSTLAFIDRSGQSPSTTGTVSGNNFYCTYTHADATDTCVGTGCTANPMTIVPSYIYPACAAGYEPKYECDVTGGCDSGGACNYAGLTIQSNTFDGGGVGVFWNSSWNLTHSGTGNTYQNGAQNVCGARS